VGSQQGGLIRAAAVGVLLHLVVLASPGASAAQDAPPDTLPMPSADTLAVGEPAPLPSPGMAPWPRPVSEGFDLSVWMFDADRLARFQGLSLLDLLVLIPGIELVRSGGFGRPTGLHALGAGGGRVRVFRDGIELDALESATLDLQRVGVAELEALRVERGLTGIRLDLFTRRLHGDRPFSQIEAATGDYQTRFLRAVFHRAISSRDVLLAHFEVTDTDGIGAFEPFAFNAFGGRWSRTLTSWLDGELQLRRTLYERGGAVVEGARFDEMHLRLRGRPIPGAVLEGFLATAHRKAGGADPFVEPLRSTQLGLRALTEARLGRMEAVLRTRSTFHGYHEPRTELELLGELVPLGRLRTLADLRIADGRTEGELRVSAGLPAGFDLFGGVSAGRRALGLLGDTVFEVVRVVEGDTLVGDTILPAFPWEATELRGARAGAAWSAGGWRLAAAAMRLAPGLSAPFGVAFDRDMPAQEVDGGVGLEARARIPLPVRGAALAGDWVGWTDIGGRPHLPRESWRIALHFHRLFYEGNLEPTLRVDAARRGAARVPLAAGGAAESLPTVFFNLYLQIRVIDVRAFVHWENVFNDRSAADIPGLALPGQRAVYGVRWQFFD
jgi:hypothetical protein